MTESEIPHPREATALFGMEAAETEFLTAYASGRLHHAWLICGPKGIGKATLAHRLARTLLAADDEAAARRMLAGSHADLLVLEPPVDPDKEEARREIPVEQARAAGDFLAHTPGEGAWRVVIVDSADEMNANAANALLKVLEEPPPRAVLLLVAHNFGRLLPTIRSRCRMLRVPPPGLDAFRRVMRLHAPGLNDLDAHRLGVLSRFSPGAALALHSHNGLELYANFVQLAGQGGDVLAFASYLTGGQVHTRWQLTGQLAMRFFERAAELAIGADFTELVPGEAAACRLLPPHKIADLHTAALEQFSVAARLHLDYKTAMITFLHSLQRAA